MTAAPSTRSLLVARARAALQDLAEYEPTSLADLHALIEAVAGRDALDDSLTDQLATVIERAGRSQHLTELPDQGDLVQACTAYHAGIVLGPTSDGADVIVEALAAIQEPWKARSSDDFHRAYNVITDTVPTDSDIERLADRALAHMTGPLR